MTDATHLPLFERYTAADVVDLIREHPLAWVLPIGASPEVATLLPLLPDLDASDDFVSLTGHVARRNPLMAALQAQPRATILFTGPQAYVSPACVSDPAWAPTWNYAQARVEAQVQFRPEATGEALARLVATMDAGDGIGWTTREMGPRYGPMERVIIAFEAKVISVHGRFKLGQDERPERLREIFERHPDAGLVRWMRRMNAERL